MTEPSPFPRVDKDARKRLADDAKELLTDPAHISAMLALRKEYFGMLMTLRPGDPSFKDRQDELCAKLRALEEYPGRLTSFIRDHERGH